MADEPRVPYVKFEKRPVEDREASIAKGHYMAKDETYAIITPPGTKDEIVKQVDDWLRDSASAAREGRIPETWLHHYNQLYNAFKAGEELPEVGHPVKDWPAVSPAQVVNLIAANIRTVEDLADAPEGALEMLGMGAHGLRDRARAWIDSAEGQGKVAEELNALRKKNSQLEGKLKSSEEKVEALVKRLDELEKAPAA